MEVLYTGKSWSWSWTSYKVPPQGLILSQDGCKCSKSISIYSTPENCQTLGSSWLFRVPDRTKTGPCPWYNSVFGFVKVVYSTPALSKFIQSSTPASRQVSFPCCSSLMYWGYTRHKVLPKIQICRTWFITTSVTKNLANECYNLFDRTGEPRHRQHPQKQSFCASTYVAKQSLSNAHSCVRYNSKFRNSSWAVISHENWCPHWWLPRIRYFQRSLIGDSRVKHLGQYCDTIAYCTILVMPGSQFGSISGASQVLLLVDSISTRVILVQRQILEQVRIWKSCESLTL